MALKKADPMLEPQIHVLLLADSEMAAAPVVEALRSSKNITTEFALLTPRGLHRDLRETDVILACPSDKGSTCLRLLREIGAQEAQVGFIVLGIQRKQGSIKTFLNAGADDYVSLPELDRLPFSIKNTFERIERSRSVARAGTTHNDLMKLMNSAGIGLALVDPAEEAVVQANTALYQIRHDSSSEPESSIPLARFVARDASESFSANLNRMQAGSGEPYGFRSALSAKDGISVNVDCAGIPVKTSAGNRVMLLFKPLSEPNGDNEMLKAAGNSPAIRRVVDYATFTLSKEGEVVSWNVSGARLTGYQDGDLIGKPFSVLFSEDDKAAMLPRRLLDTAKEKGYVETEFNVVTKSDESFPARVTITPLPWLGNDPAGYSIVLRQLDNDGSEQHDIIDRERELHALADHLEMMRESERTRISHKLHDEFGQVLTALRLDLTILNRMISKNVDSVKRIPLLEKLSVTSQLVESMIKATRRTITELRPPVLDELGLPTAILWQAQEFEDRTGIRCRIEELQHTVALGDKESTAVFRIFQESLANVALHAKAANVSVTAQVANSFFVLRVTDDGIGLDVSRLRETGTYGLLGIRERVTALGGEFDIHSKPGKGTTLTIRIPYRGR